MGSPEKFRRIRPLPPIMGGADIPPGHEDSLFALASIQEMNLDDPAETGAFVSFLNNVANREHFTNPPSTIEELRSMFNIAGVHPLVARNIRGDIVGGAAIFDAPRTEHDHVLRFIVIDPRMQNRGLGRQMLTQVIDWAFREPASDGRMRMKLDVNVIEGVSGWERMTNLLESLHFTHMMRLPQEVDVFSVELGVMVTRATHRWELMRNNWVPGVNSSPTNSPTN